MSDVSNVTESVTLATADIPLGDAERRHDPLCPDADPNRWVSTDFNGNSFSCRCDEYARVREDEATRAHRMSEAYRSALRDAVEAVKALEALLNVPKSKGGYDCCGCSTIDQLHDDAVTAIEALGGER